MSQHGYRMFIAGVLFTMALAALAKLVGSELAPPAGAAANTPSDQDQTLWYVVEEATTTRPELLRIDFPDGISCLDYGAGGFSCVVREMGE